MEEEATTHSLIGNFLTAVSYVFSEFKKSKKNFLVGSTTVFLVVFTLSLLQSAVEVSPVIFLKLAEDSVGEYDLIMTPSRDSSGAMTFVNSTDIAMKLEGNNHTIGVVPRWLFMGNLVNLKTNANTSSVLMIIDSKKEEEMGLGREWKHPPLEGASLHASGSLLREIGVEANNNEIVGLDFDLLNIAYTLSGSALPEKKFFESFLDPFVESIEEQDLSNLNEVFSFLPEDFDYAPFVRLLGVAISSFNFTDENYYSMKESLTFKFNFTVVDEIKQPKGKYPFALGSAIIIESSYVNDQIIKSLKNAKKGFEDALTTYLDTLELDTITQATVRVLIDNFLAENDLYLAFNDFVNTFNLNDYALMAIAMYKERFTSFIKDTQSIKDDVSLWTNEISTTLGLDYPVTYQIPLVDAVRLVYYLRLFLDQLLIITEGVLVGISVYLIYSLLISDVEGKVYECGMLRALGMEQYTLIELLVIQSLMFSAAGIATGLLFGWLGLYPVIYFISLYTSVPLDWALSVNAIVLSSAVGIIMPCGALIGPTQRALSHSLRDALDIYHNKENDTTVTFQKLENLGLSPSQVALATLSVVFGFVVYYLIPYSFIFFNLSLFFNIFSAIIIGMLVGFAFLAMTIHPFVQRAFANLLMWGADRKSLKHLVMKNLVGHASRNIKTAILFTFCIAFIIFTGSIFTLQGANIVAQAKIGVGSDISVQSFSIEQSIDYSSIKNYLEKRTNEENSAILGYTISSFPMDSHTYIRRTYISTLADFAHSTVMTIGVDRNFQSETFDQYTAIKEYDTSIQYEYTPNGALDVVKSLYDHPSIASEEYFPPSQVLSNLADPGELEKETHLLYENVMDVIMSEAVRLPSSLDTNSPTELRVDVITSQKGDHTSREAYYFLLNPRAMVSKMAGFLFSSYSQTATYSPVLMTMDNYMKLLQYCYERSAGPETADYPSEIPVRGVYVRLTDDATMLQREDIINGIRNFVRSSRIVITDVAVIISSTDTAILVLNIFFTVVSLNVIILCFFVLLISFTSNVTENAWEFGVLRAIGLNSWQVIRVYIYEAMTIVFSSVFLGLIIGEIISLTLTLQANLFSELPFKFEFPGLLFLSIVIMSLIVSFFGSYIPASQLKKKRIANALKNM